MHGDRNRARDRPGSRRTEAAPERHQHGGEEDRHQQVEPDAPRLRHERSGEIAGQGRGDPDHPERDAGAEQDADVAPALGVIARADQPTRVREEEQVEGEPRRRLLREPGLDRSAHQNHARIDDGSDGDEGEKGRQRPDLLPDLERHHLRRAGEDEGAYGEGLVEA